MVNLVHDQVVKEKRYTSMQTKNCLTGSQHFSPGDIQFQLVFDRGQYAESNNLKNKDVYRKMNSGRMVGHTSM